MARRVLQIRLIKDPRVTAPLDREESSVDFTVDNIVDGAERVIRTIGIAVVGHVVLDTLRQVLVAKATRG